MLNSTEALWALAVMRMRFAKIAAHSGGRVWRLPLMTMAAVAGLTLACSGAEAARIWLPKTENPYCDVTTYRLREVPEQAMSLLDSSGKPAIVVSGLTLADRPLYGRFLLAHECCHHSLGHVGRYREGLGHVGPQPFFYIAPALRQMELDADCCAVKLLKQRQQTDSIRSAEDAMAAFGDTPTGAYYPTGNERVENIEKCAAED